MEKTGLNLWLIYVSHTALCWYKNIWLFNNQLDKLSAIPGTCFHAVSGMPSNILLTGRPYGGKILLTFVDNLDLLRLTT